MRHLADATNPPQLIESYGDGGFRVSGTAYKGSIVILPGRTEGWHVADISALTAQDLATVTGAQPPVEILLLGCGARTVEVPQSSRAKLKKHGIVVEPMSTGAACRTYNLLIAEGRQVAGAFVSVE
ncbi:MAG: Mth938-like domain-containing protein [Alphaproteobacteria bacterium]